MSNPAGYTGSICSTCGGARMVRTGVCETCQDCGTSSGCSRGLETNNGRRDRGEIMRILYAAVLALLLPACLAAPIDRAGDRADQAVTLAAEKARQIAQDATTALDARMAAQIADLAAKADAARAAALVDVSARLDAQRVAVAAELDRQRTETLAALRAEREALTAVVERQSAAWREESAAWRVVAARGVDEVAAVRAQVGPIVEAFSAGAGGQTPGPSPGGSTSDEQWLLWGGAAGGAFSLLKTGVRLWKSYKAAAPDSPDGRCQHDGPCAPPPKEAAT